MGWDEVRLHEAGSQRRESGRRKAARLHHRPRVGKSLDGCYVNVKFMRGAILQAHHPNAQLIYVLVFASSAMKTRKTRRYRYNKVEEPPFSSALPRSFRKCMTCPSSETALLRLPIASRRHLGTHTLQLRGELRIFLLHLQLRPRRFSVGERVDDLAFGPAEFGGALEVLECFRDLALLEEELGHGCDCYVAFGVDCEV